MSITIAEARCRCHGCVQVEDELVGHLVAAYAEEKATLARLGFTRDAARSRISETMRRDWSEADRRDAGDHPEATADERLNAYEAFTRAAARALDVLHPPS